VSAHGSAAAAPPDVAYFVALERRVWQALAEGDREADLDLLDADFLGVYPSGFADRADHAGQLAAGPSIDRYSISAPRLLVLSADAVVLSYRADFTRPGTQGTPAAQTMYVSSVWARRGERWRNVLSQDTVAARR